MTIISTAEILDALGRKRTADALGVGVTAIGNAAADGLFPANWFFVISEMCKSEGIECPVCLFRMRGRKREKGHEAASADVVEAEEAGTAA